MRIGLDFDNTIVCYDQAIKQLADELLELPEDDPRTKLGLRDHLRALQAANHSGPHFRASYMARACAMHSLIKIRSPR